MNRRCMIVLSLVGWLGGSASFAQPPAAPGGPAPYYLPSPMPANPMYPQSMGQLPAMASPGMNFAPAPPGGYGYGPPGFYYTAAPGGTAQVPAPPAFPPGQPTAPGQPGAVPDGTQGQMPPGTPPPGMMPVAGQVPPEMMPCCPPPSGVQMPSEPIEVPPPMRGHIPFYVGVEYLHWYVRRPSLPPLLTVGDINDFTFNPPINIPAAIGSPRTHTLLEQFPKAYAHDGLRVNTGIWLDPGQVLGVQGSFIWLKSIDPKVSVSGDGSNPTMVIGRPYVSVLNAAESADPVVSPGSIAGQISFSNPQRFYGADFNLVYNFLSSESEGVRMGLLLGGRFLAFDEQIKVEQIRIQLPDPFLNLPGPIEGIEENFTTHNRFYGGQIGGQTECSMGPLVFQILAKCAFGYNQEVVRIKGIDSVITPADPALGLPQTVFQSPYTLLVGPGNVGNHTRSVFSIVPEGQVNVCWNCNDTVAITGGYTLIYWANMVRPGKEIDRVINVQNINDFAPTPPIEPKFLFHNDNIWIQGFQAGIQLSF